MFGYSVNSAGDVNGDGFSDVIVGALSDGGNSEGSAAIFHGSANGLATSASKILEGDIVNRHLGYSVAGAGDINNDGCDDIIVGTPFVSGQQFGIAQAHFGSAAGVSTATAWSTVGINLGEQFGYSVAPIGDVNDDNFDDFVVGAPGNPFNGTGRAFAWYGTADTLTTVPSWTITATLPHTDLGSRVAGAGDLNLDGYADILVSQPRVSTTGSLTQGRVQIFAGSDHGLSTTPTQTIEHLPPPVSNVVSSAVAGAGDVNGDGTDDIIIGTPGAASTPAGSYGGARIHYGIPPASSVQRWSLFY